MGKRNRRKPKAGKDIQTMRNGTKASPVKVTYADGTQRLAKPGAFANTTRPATLVGRTRRERYDWYINHSPEWRRLRVKVLERDGHRCSRCPATMTLHVHHLTYVRFGGESLNDLVTLCESCHEKEHAAQAKVKRAAVLASQRRKKAAS